MWLDYVRYVCLEGVFVFVMGGVSGIGVSLVVGFVE